MKMVNKLILLIVFLFQSITAQINPRDLIISTYPSDGSIDIPQISQDKLVINFSENMNHESVVNGIKISPGFSYSGWFPPKWVENKFHYYSRFPEAPAGDKSFDYIGSPFVDLTLLSGTTYTVTLDTTVQTADGRYLSEPFTIRFTTAEGIYDRNNIKDYTVDLYKTVYDITLTDPFIARNYYSRVDFGSKADYWVSIAYIDSIPYRLFVADDGSYLRGHKNIEEQNAFHYLPPKGNIKILNAIIDYNNSNIGSIFKNELISAQDSINNTVMGYFRSIGVTDTVYFIRNTNLLINFDDLNYVQQQNDPYGTRIYDNIINYANNLGYERINFEVVIVFRMNPSDGIYPFAGIANVDDNFILLEDGFANESYKDYKYDEIYSMAYTGYYHELYHLFGWEHNMPLWSDLFYENTDPEINHLLDKPNIYVLPGIFGWEDIDGDGIIEIVDTTPYGLMKSTTEVSKTEDLPVDFHLMQNYPNPFNPTTIIRYGLPTESKVTIKIYNLLGQEIKQLINNYETAGYHEKTFNARNLASGTYFYRIVANSIDGKNNFANTKKLILIK